MVNIRDFLLKSNIDTGTYALVMYDNETEPTWFTKYNLDEGKVWFLESPCDLYKIREVQESIEEFAKEYASLILEDDASDVDIEGYIDQYIMPMIVDGCLYEIENFQYAPYLPEYVDDIKLISQRECLEYLLGLK